MNADSEGGNYVLKFSTENISVLCGFKLDLNVIELNCQEELSFRRH